MDQDPHGAAGGTGAGQEPGTTPRRERRFGATRVRPRVEFGPPKQTEPRPAEPPPSASPTPEIVDDGLGGDALGPGAGMPFGGGADPFAPRTFAGGRVRVYGCSPGCLGASLLLSLLLTLLLNALL